MSYKSVLIALLAASTVFASCACAAPKKKEAVDKQAILITAFGTSMPSARKAIDNLVNAAKKAFPGADVRLAFTSNIIRRKLTREGKKNVPPTPVQALAALNDEGFKNVCVMPTHIIPGAEYDEIKNVVDAWKTLTGKYGFKDLRLGKTFLSSVDACDEMADILIKRFAKVPADTAVVLMGHGTPHHIANAMYSQLQVALDKKADGRFFIGTVENTPLIEDVVVALKKAGLKKTLLSPLMIVAGDHANNDMADKDDPESWYSILKKEGFAVETMIKGLGEDAGIAAAFVEHLKAALK
jgi:sirohydrochlorin cobaltochelatase